MTNKRRNPLLIAAAGAGIVLALIALIWQMRSQSQAPPVGSVTVPAGPLAGSAPNQEEHKMLQQLREHPELARQRVPSGAVGSQANPPLEHPTP